MTRLIFLLVGAAALAAGCRPAPAAPADAAERAADRSGAVTASRTSDGVRVTNGTGRTVAYAVWARGFLGLFGACADDSPSCPKLAPGASVVVGLGEITGLAAEETAAVVRWWHLEADGTGGLRPGDVHEVVVPL